MSRQTFPWLLAWFLSCPALAQGNYEIQVYGSETVAPRTVMVELHSNFTATGEKQTLDGVYPTHHQLHETLELTQGLTDWSELGFYVFTSIQSGHGAQWVGDHIRPRVRVPDSWDWPVGLSLSMEFGYQRAVYSPDTWTWEIRPIVDKAVGPWYIAFNPALQRTVRGPGVVDGFQFEPGLKIGYAVHRGISAGFEYYGDWGRLEHLAPAARQQHQVFAVADLDVSADWEINFGVGVGLTAATDHLIFKAILGRRLNWARVGRFK